MTKKKIIVLCCVAALVIVAVVAAVIVLNKLPMPLNYPIDEIEAVNILTAKTRPLIKRSTAW